MPTRKELETPEGIEFCQNVKGKMVELYNTQALVAALCGITSLSLLSAPPTPWKLSISGIEDGWESPWMVGDAEYPYGEDGWISLEVASNCIWAYTILQSISFMSCTANILIAIILITTSATQMCHPADIIRLNLNFSPANASVFLIVGIVSFLAGAAPSTLLLVPYPIGITACSIMFIFYLIIVFYVIMIPLRTRFDIETNVERLQRKYDRMNSNE